MRTINARSILLVLDAINMAKLVVFTVEASIVYRVVVENLNHSVFSKVSIVIRACIEYPRIGIGLPLVRHSFFES
jgi:hypothetical protein